MPWMRLAIGVGGIGMLAGVAGMFVWIDDDSNYFGVAVALASAGFMTLVACVLTDVFGSSHGSQDDAFRRGREMGYDAGFLEGHRTARPVVVPMHALDRDLETPDREVGHEVESDTPTAMPMWQRDTMPVRGRGATHDGRDQVVAWVGGRRIPLMAGALCLAMIGVMVANAMVSAPAPTETSHQSPGGPSGQAVPPSRETTGLVGEPAPSGGFGAVVAGRSNLSSATGTSLVVAAGAVGARSGAQPGSSNQSSLPGVAVLASYLPAGAPVASPPSPPSPPSPAPPASPPVVTAPAVLLTAAEQTAADALAAANLTAADALAASNLTAANAAAAAAETARVAAAAAEATRVQAAADAYAVAHPVG